MANNASFNLRCREGDMALIIREMPGCERNIGRAVIVQGPVEVHPDHGPTWLIEPVSPEPWAVHEYGGKPVWVGTISFASLVEHPDEWLLPLRPEDEVYRRMLEEEDPHIVRINKDKVMRRYAFLRELENLERPGYELPAELDEDAKKVILSTWKRLKEQGKDAQSLVKTGRRRD